MFFNRLHEYGDKCIQNKSIYPLIFLYLSILCIDSFESSLNDVYKE